MIHAAATMIAISVAMAQPVSLVPGVIFAKRQSCDTDASRNGFDVILDRVRRRQALVHERRVPLNIEPVIGLVRIAGAAARQLVAYHFGAFALLRVHLQITGAAAEDVLERLRSLSLIRIFAVCALSRG
jgi:hypothetical protein